MTQNKTGRRPAQLAYTPIISADREPQRWLRERQKHLTATDMASIVGVPGARSALETWYQKKDALMARAENDAIIEAKRAGHDFEDYNALMFAKAAGRRVERCQLLMASVKHKWLACTVDYSQYITIITGAGDVHRDERPLELKNAGSFAAQDMWPLGGEPHVSWQVQLHTQLIVMDVPQGSLSAWLGSPFVHHRWCDLERDPKIEEILLEEGTQFWKSLKRKTPPANLDNPVAAYEVLRRLDPKRATGKVIKLPREAQAIDSRIRTFADICERSKQRYDEAKALVEQEKGKLALLIGENAAGKLPDGTTWTFKHVHVPAHNVAEHSYRKLNRVSVVASKQKRTTWKTSNK